MTTRSLIIAATSASVGVLALVGWSVWASYHPEPTLDEVPALAASKRFDEAASRVEAYLVAHPADSPAHFLFAQLTLDRPSPPPAGATRALTHLDRMTPGTSRQKALVELYRGKAYYFTSRFDEAELAWSKAIDIDPTVPEAVWGMLDMFYMQLRTREANQLALRQHKVEPDPRDRVRLLLELIRQDYQDLAPAAVASWFRPKLAENPDDFHASLALARALVLDSKVDEGLALLNKQVDRRPHDPDAWDALLAGLDDGGASSESMVEAFHRVPAHLAKTPRFARHRGRLAQERRDWKAAIDAYQIACRFDPTDPKTRYRLARAFRFAGETAEADRADRARQDFRAANHELRALYDEADADKTLGQSPNPDLYRRLASLRERMSRPGEALAWHRLALQSDPGDATSELAVKRLTPLVEAPNE